MSRGLGCVQRAVVDALPVVAHEEEVRFGSSFAELARNKKIMVAASLPALLEHLYGCGYTRAQRNAVARACYALADAGHVGLFWRRMTRPKGHHVSYRDTVPRVCLWIEILSVDATDNCPEVQHLEKVESAA